MSAATLYTRDGDVFKTVTQLDVLREAVSITYERALTDAAELTPAAPEGTRSVRMFFTVDAFFHVARQADNPTAGAGTRRQPAGSYREVWWPARPGDVVAVRRFGGVSGMAYIAFCN